ncbi:hypothetical protein UY3_04113 [Chelonia mydas]|uniref:Uncharacterized protein n=1 Tax=Chelonia mydas TaxID=8469 RepID=M7BNJ0_CHEMY|nr:hypothetical protein UY3_04113 [Chelonia mydas]
MEWKVPPATKLPPKTRSGRNGSGSFTLGVFGGSERPTTTELPPKTLVGAPAGAGAWGKLPPRAALLETCGATVKDSGVEKVKNSFNIFKIYMADKCTNANRHQVLSHYVCYLDVRGHQFESSTDEYDDPYVRDSSRHQRSKQVLGAAVRKGRQCFRCGSNSAVASPFRRPQRQFSGSFSLLPSAAAVRRQFLPSAVRGSNSTATVLFTAWGGKNSKADPGLQFSVDKHWDSDSHRDQEERDFPFCGGFCYIDITM